VLTSAKIPHGPGGFGAYGIPVSIVNCQWRYQRADGNPRVGVILSNCDGVPLQEMIRQEIRAITRAPADGGSGG
jgi:hypothetical protein